MSSGRGITDVAHRRGRNTLNSLDPEHPTPDPSDIHMRCCFICEYLISVGWERKIWTILNPQSRTKALKLQFELKEHHAL